MLIKRQRRYTRSGKLEINWKRAIEFVLASEGGLSDDKADSGGLTNKGLTHTDIDAWNHSHGTSINIRALTTAQAEVIYKSKYWFASGADKLGTGLDAVHFDTAVNMGLAQATICLNRSYNPGWSSRALAFAYLADRSGVYKRIIDAHPKDEVFRVGWNNRILALKALVNELAPAVKA